MKNEPRDAGNVVLKSGLWYTVSNFLFRAFAFLTTPLFARILSKAEYGEFSNITSWVNILFILTACDLYTSVIRAKLDYEDDLNRYGFSVLTAGSIITSVLFILVMLFRSTLSALMGIQEKYIPFLFLYLFFVQGFYVYITIERAHYRYKAFSLLSGIVIVASCLLSLLLLFLLPDKLDARVYGQYAPYIVLGIIMYILVAKRGRKVHLPYCKYGLMLSLPMVPHLLSMNVLSSSDRIMITKLCGAEFTAVYSIAHIVSNIVGIFLDSLNKAFAPWILDSMKAGKNDAIKRMTIPYFGIFVIINIGILLVAPEIVWILGGEAYRDSIFVMPPLIIGCVFQFVYTMYVQVEFYKKKMRMVAIGTSIAALINIGLNYVLIPKFGYIAAGYTTLIGYVVLFLIHYYTVCKLGYKNLYDRRVLFGGMALALAIMPIMIALYHTRTLRYAVLILYVAAIFLALFHYRKTIANFIAGRKR